MVKSVLERFIKGGVVDFMEKGFCEGCLHFSVYYRRGAAGFARVGKGFCYCFGREMVSSGCCGSFERGDGEELRLALLVAELERAVVSINQIAQILKESAGK